MNYQLVIIFCVLSLVNVILQTIKALLTINGSKFVAAISNAVAFLYTIVIVYMSCDLPLWAKVIITMITNFVGVYISKWLVSSFTKDKLWKLDVSIPKQFTDNLDKELQDIPHSKIEVDNWTLFHCYCATQNDTQTVTEISRKYGAKFFASESKF